jgi:hypothetical protein
VNRALRGLDVQLAVLGRKVLTKRLLQLLSFGALFAAAAVVPGARADLVSDSTFHGQDCVWDTVSSLPTRMLTSLWS